MPTSISNFGSATQLQVKRSQPGFNREAYIKFDLSSVATISSAKLRLLGNVDNTEASSVTIGVYTAPSTWTETGLTFNNRPMTTGAAIKTFTVTCPPGLFAAGGSVAVPGKNVTLLKSTPTAGGKAWSFTIGSPVTNGADQIVVSVNCYRPVLIGLGLKKKAKFKVKTASGPVVTVPPGGTTDTKVKCPAGSAPVAPGDDPRHHDG